MKAVLFALCLVAAATAQKQCTECPLGTYRDGPSCLTCPGVDGLMNQINAVEGSVSEDNCIMCVNGTGPNVEMNECLLCPAGTYGDRGSCSPCPAGEYTDEPGLIDVESCKKCPPGYEVNEKGDGCNICPAGTYTTGDMRECVACSVGRYSRVAGATSNICSVCGAGHETNKPDEEGASDCKLCPAGRYAESGSTRCRTCDSGRYGTSSGGVDPDEACEGLCRAGQVPNDEESPTGCSSCPPGTYSTNGIECEDCDRGYQPHHGAQNLGSCGNCPLGKEPNEEHTKCTTCEPGRYSTDGYYECRECDGNFVSSEAGASEHDDPCTECPPNTRPNWAKSACICVDGQYKDEASGGCFSCAVGKSSPSEEDTSKIALSPSECFDCPAGTYGIDNGDNRTACVLCPEGRFSATIGSDNSTTCEACPRGRFTDYRGATECTPCAPGFHNNFTSQMACSPCDAGKFVATEGSLDSDACQDCAAGSYSNRGSAECTLCEAGRYGSADRIGCLDCPVNTFSTLVGATGQSDCQACSGAISAAGTSNKARWLAGPWKDCDKYCKTRREVWCVDDLGRLASSSSCSGPKPITTSRCQGDHCDQACWENSDDIHTCYNNNGGVSNICVEQETQCDYINERAAIYFRLINFQRIAGWAAKDFAKEYPGASALYELLLVLARSTLARQGGLDEDKLDYTLGFDFLDDNTADVIMSFGTSYTTRRFDQSSGRRFNETSDYISCQDIAEDRENECLRRCLSDSNCVQADLFLNNDDCCLRPEGSFVTVFDANVQNFEKRPEEDPLDSERFLGLPILTDNNDAATVLRANGLDISPFAEYSSYNYYENSAMTTGVSALLVAVLVALTALNL